MRTVRLTILGFALALLAACGTSHPTAADADVTTTTTQACGYLGSAGCP